MDFHQITKSEARRLDALDRISDIDAEIRRTHGEVVPPIQDTNLGVLTVEVNAEWLAWILEYMLNEGSI